ncbi:hypothetical protein ACFQY4_06735 [Catellatospora bangladeshensis]|uniref:hypothetical protein n=1 Tax=Catellatospora bangladeshensis TaxID=310355 RepID=UPI00360AAFAC
MRLGEADPAVRARLLDGCRARLLRGGRPGELRGYLRMHDELKPAPAEVAPAAADYVRLVEGGNPTVAGMAQRALRDADEAGLLGWDTVRDVAAAALARPEKILVKTQTAWLRRAARRRPEHAGEITELLAPPQPEALPVPVALPVPAPAPLGPPLDGLPQVTEELSAMLAGDWSVPTVERVLAGIAHWRVHDQDALARAVRPLVDGNHPGWGRLAEQLRSCCSRSSSRPAGRRGGGSWPTCSGPTARCRCGSCTSSACTATGCTWCSRCGWPRCRCSWAAAPRRC